MAVAVMQSQWCACDAFFFDGGLVILGLCYCQLTYLICPGIFLQQKQLSEQNEVLQRHIQQQEAAVGSDWPPLASVNLPCTCRIGLCLRKQIIVFHPSAVLTSTTHTHMHTHMHTSLFSGAS